MKYVLHSWVNYATKKKSYYYSATVSCGLKILTCTTVYVF